MQNLENYRKILEKHGYGNVSDEELIEISKNIGQLADVVLAYEKNKKIAKTQTKQCLCDNPTCAKCLGVNCQDDNCKIHTKEAKLKFKNRNN